MNLFIICLYVRAEILSSFDIISMFRALIVVNYDQRELKFESFLEFVWIKDNFCISLIIFVDLPLLLLKLKLSCNFE